AADGSSTRVTPDGPASALGPAGEALLQRRAIAGPEGDVHAYAAGQVRRRGGQVGADLGIQRGDGAAIDRTVGDVLGEALLRLRLAGEGDEAACLLGLADALGQRPVVEVVDAAVPGEGQLRLLDLGGGDPAVVGRTHHHATIAEQ